MSMQTAEEHVALKIKRNAAKYEVSVDGKWTSITHAARAPNKWLHCRLVDGSHAKFPPHLWRYKVKEPA